MGQGTRVGFNVRDRATCTDVVVALRRHRPPWKISFSSSLPNKQKHVGGLTKGIVGPGSRTPGMVDSGSSSCLGSSKMISPPKGNATFRGRPRGRFAGGGVNDVVSIGVVLSANGSTPFRLGVRGLGLRRSRMSPSHAFFHRKFSVLTLSGVIFVMRCRVGPCPPDILFFC